MGMKLEISSRVVDAIVAAADARPDAEICGLLFGGAGRIDDFQLCSNVASDPACAFEIDPAQLLAAHKAMRAGGPNTLGCFHSHPGGSTAPSLRDAEMAAPDGSFWLIAARSEIGIWRAVANGVRHDRFDPVAWHLGPSSCASGAASPQEPHHSNRSASVS